MPLKYISYIFLSVCLVSCQSTGSGSSDKKVAVPDSILGATVKDQKSEIIHDTAFVNLKTLSADFVYEMRYASNNNFLNKKVYSCDNCLLRYRVAKALISANDKLLKQNLRIKLFDCFRPVSVQRKMWKIMPDSRYVANPNKNGSVHNRGAAVDLTIVDSIGKELDMGTGFDHFGKEAHHDYIDFKEEVISNRKLLKSTMKNAGFNSIKTEWWHYQLGKKADYPISTTAICED